MRLRSTTTLACLAALLLAAVTAEAKDRKVADSTALRNALRRAKPGDRVLLAPGEYRGVSVSKVEGTKARPIVVQAADPKKPPVFAGGKQGLHLSGCSHVTLSHLVIRGCSTNGINIDDGGTFDTPARGIVVQNVTVEDIGPRGNFDALKLSGLDGFTVRDCMFTGWGGSAVDMVGCKNGVVERCRFVGKEGFSQSNAVQMKGGTRRVVVHLSFFKDCGHRSINLGGSTGLAYFRPKVGDFEAKEVVVAGNRFHGSQAPIAWVSAVGGHVHHNTIHRPGKWFGRILQETEDERFQRCRDGVFEYNLVVFSRHAGGTLNVGPRTKPKTFKFRRNVWFCEDGPKVPLLPVPDKDAVYHVDPVLEKPGTAEMRMTSGNPKIRHAGADAYRPAKDPLSGFGKEGG